MTVQWKPADMPTISLALPGGAKLIAFMKTVFDAETKRVYEMGEGLVAHAEIRLGDSLVMTGDASGEHTIPPASASVYVPDCEAAYARALAAGATSKEAPKDQFYGDRTARVVDPFGNQWSIATHTEDVDEEEMGRRMKAWEAQQASR
jgi:PhnB protein